MDKKNVRLHIRAAKRWLDEAEKWLEKSSIPRTISNLLLAVAEIQMPLRSQFAPKREESKQKSAEEQPIILKRAPVYALAATILLALALGVQVFRQPNSQMASNRAIPKKATHQARSKIVKPEPESTQELKQPLKQIQATPKLRVSSQRVKRAFSHTSTPPELRSKRQSKAELPRKKVQVMAKLPGTAKPNQGALVAPPATIPTKRENPHLDVIDLMVTAEQALKGKTE